MKSWSRTFTGPPAAATGGPAWRYRPTSSFFFASTRPTGSPAARNSATRALTCRNWASRSGCWLPSSTFDIALQPYPPPARSGRPRPSGTQAPRAISRSSSRSDREHHVTAATGSPRVPPPPAPAAPPLTPVPAPPAACARAPGRRDRPAASPPSPPDSISDAPAATVACEHPAARATAAIPPCPSARASDPRYNRHCRSPSPSRRVTANFAASPASASPETAIAHPATLKPETTC